MTRVADAHATLQELTDALDGVTFSVIVEPATGASSSSDWWAMRIDDLAVSVCEYGFQATEDALAEAVTEEVSRRIENGTISAPECGLVIRLYLAARTGQLSELLQSAQIVEVESLPEYLRPVFEPEPEPTPIADERVRGVGSRLRRWWSGRHRRGTAQ